MPTKTLLYAGPSLNDKSKELIESLGLDLRPPAQRYDFQTLMEQGFQGTIILVDGYFKQVMAIGHAEIREAMKQDCTVYGLSSMGAIRAFEMKHLGMKGYGKTYEWFFKMDDFQDDEVALLHAPSPLYYPISEPLVHFRECIQDLISKNRLSVNIASSIIQEMKSLYYGDRTMEMFLNLLMKLSEKNTIEFVKNNFANYRIKQLDLVEFLERKIWLTA